MNNEPSKADTPVVAFLNIIWDNCTKGKHDSWRLLNHAMHQALKLAINVNMEFAPDDFKTVAERFRAGYWWSDGEGMYAEAVMAPGGIGTSIPNRSAAISFEQMQGRKPYILHGDRLAIGSAFQWPMPGKKKGQMALKRVWVTAIGSDAISVCWYDNAGQWREGKPKQRTTITHAQLREASREQRKAE